MITVNDLKQFPLFVGLDNEELSAITGFSTRQRYSNNDIIFDPKSTIHEIFLVESGYDAVQIEIPIQDKNTRMVIHTISKGETFGWIAFGQPHLKTAIARCVDDVSVIKIDVRKLMGIMDKNNHMGYVVMRNLSNIIISRLAYTTVTFRHEIQKLLRKQSELLTPEHSR